MSDLSIENLTDEFKKCNVETDVEKDVNEDRVKNKAAKIIQENYKKYKKFKIEFNITTKNSKEYNYKTHTWDLSNQLDLSTFLEETKYPFEYGGCIKSRIDETHKDEKKRIGYNIFETEKFKNKEQLLYLMTISKGDTEKIIKGGKVKGTLSTRSYKAGIEDSWTMKGTPSPTNYIFSQIFRKCMQINMEVKFYVHPAPLTKVPYQTSAGEEKYIVISPYEAMEKNLNLHLKELLGRNLIGEGNLEQLYKD
jgi:hypothetical protein